MTLNMFHTSHISNCRHFLPLPIENPLCLSTKHQKIISLVEKNTVLDKKSISTHFFLRHSFLTHMVICYCTLLNRKFYQVNIPMTKLLRSNKNGSSSIMLQETMGWQRNNKSIPTSPQDFRFLLIYVIEELISSIWALLHFFPISVLCFS